MKSGVVPNELEMTPLSLSLSLSLRSLQCLVGVVVFVSRDYVVVSCLPAISDLYQAVIKNRISKELFENCASKKKKKGKG